MLEIMPEGHGFLRSSDYNYLASPDDVLVTKEQIKQYALRSGDVVDATLRAPREGDKYFPLSSVKASTDVLSNTSATAWHSSTSPRFSLTKNST